MNFEIKQEKCYMANQLIMLKTQSSVRGSSFNEFIIMLYSCIGMKISYVLILWEHMKNKKKKHDDVIKRL